MDLFLQNAVAGAGAHLGRVVQAMIDGVAFAQDDGKTYDVFSHEGDEMGSFTTADINFATNYMKRLGRPVGKTLGYKCGIAFSFAWIGWHPWHNKAAT